MTKRQALEGRLVAEPRPGPGGLVHALRWELSLGASVFDAGPAGICSVRFATGAAIHADYADPSVLLRVDVPFGVTGPLGDEEVFRLDRLRAEDAGLVEALFGTDTLGDLRDTIRRRGSEFGSVVTRRESWETAGRVALAHQLLADRGQPVSGLWAVEITGMVEGLGIGELANAYRRSLFDAAQSAAALIPRVRERATTPAFLRVLEDLAGGSPQTEASTDEPAHSPTWDRLRARYQRISESLAVGSATKGDARPPQEAHRESASAEPVAAASEPPVHVSVDPDIECLLGESAAAVFDRSDLVVTLTPDASLNRDGAFSPLRRLQTAVVHDRARIGSSASFSPGPNGVLSARVVLPRGSIGSTLGVSVGRHVLERDLRDTTVRERQAVSAGRRLADEIRASSVIPGEHAAPDKIRRLADEARAAWRAAGRGDLASGVTSERMMPAQVAFATEEAAAVVTDEDMAALRPAAAGSPEDLAARRDFAWSVGALTVAANAERLRLEVPDELPLPVASYDALALSLARSDVAAAADLDRAFVSAERRATEAWEAETALLEAPHLTVTAEAESTSATSSPFSLFVDRVEEALQRLGDSLLSARIRPARVGQTAMASGPSATATPVPAPETDRQAPADDEDAGDRGEATVEIEFRGQQIRATLALYRNRGSGRLVIHVDGIPDDLSEAVRVVLSSPAPLILSPTSVSDGFIFFETSWKAPPKLPPFVTLVLVKSDQ